MDTRTLGIHAICVAVIALCFWVSTLLTDPLAAQALTGAGFLLWGKLSFKPAGPVLDRIVAKLEPARVERILSQRPGPPTDADAPAESPPPEVQP